MENLTLETFGNIIDDFLTENHIQMMVDMPKGTQNVDLKDNTGLGPTVQFYILLKALPAVYRELCDVLNITPGEEFIEKMLEMVRDEILGRKK